MDVSEVVRFVGSFLFPVRLAAFECVSRRARAGARNHWNNVGLLPSIPGLLGGPGFVLAEVLGHGEEDITIATILRRLRHCRPELADDISQSITRQISWQVSRVMNFVFNVYGWSHWELMPPISGLYDTLREMLPHVGFKAVHSVLRNIRRDQRILDASEFTFDEDCDLREFSFTFIGCLAILLHVDWLLNCMRHESD